MAATMEQCVSEIRKYQQAARKSGVAERPRWPMIVLRSPKGWTAPQEVGGHRLERLLAGASGPDGRRQKQSEEAS